MSGGQLSRFKEKAVSETKRLLWIAGYLWVLLGLFTLHKAIILKDPNPFYHQGFAVINALVLAKIVFIADVYNVADNLKNKPLIYPIMYRSAAFSVILILFHILEEILVGKWHGKAVSDALAASGAGSVKEIVVLGLIIFVALMPFFALRELARDFGEDRLLGQFFVRRRAFVPLQSS